jgi:hypothetical protein
VSFSDKPSDDIIVGLEKMDKSSRKEYYADVGTDVHADSLEQKKYCDESSTNESSVENQAFRKLRSASYTVNNEVIGDTSDWYDRKLLNMAVIEDYYPQPSKPNMIDVDDGPDFVARWIPQYDYDLETERNDDSSKAWADELGLENFDWDFDPSLEAVTDDGSSVNKSRSLTESEQARSRHLITQHESPSGIDAANLDNELFDQSQDFVEAITKSIVGADKNNDFDEEEFFDDSHSLQSSAYAVNRYV